MWTTRPAQFVSSLFANASVTPSATERQAATDEFGSAEFNRAFVLMECFADLRRDPNSLPDADYTGYDFWLTKLNQFNGNFVNAEMVKAFISSTEYRQRFGAN